MFRKKPDPKEMAKQQKREIRKTQRGVTRDYNQLEKQEKSLELEIKKAAKRGDKQLCTAHAKQLIAIRKQKTRNLGVGSKVTSLNSQMTAMQSNVAMANSMAASTKVMGSMNKQMNVEDIAKTMQEFEKESTKMGIAEEVIDDTLDSLFDDSGDEEEQDAIVNQVLDEIGIDAQSKMPSAPKTSMPGTSSSSKNEDKEIEDLLEQLKA